MLEKIFSLPILSKIPKTSRLKFLIAFFLLACIFSLLIYLFWDLPLPGELSSQVRNPVSTLILDRNGKLIYEIFEEKKRTPVPLSDLPDYIKQATIAIEDKDFYKHHGISPTGIARAILKIVTGQSLQGGSTITQQLIKTTLLTPERTVRRKIRELALTVITEMLYSKDEILAMYLNNVPYGGTAWGIEAAAQTYFGKSSRNLTLAEATLLAGLPAAPTRFSPFGANPELAKERQKQVLRRMVEDGYITQEQAEEAANQNLIFANQRRLRAMHFALFVKEQLVEKYGEYMVEQGGLRVTTTLDLDLQEYAENVIREEIAKLKKQNVKNAAALVTNPKTGEIYAMVGSKDYFAEDEDGKVNVTLRLRQPGSAIKPLNYALALMDKKITAATPLADVPTCFAVENQPLYCPVNYDRKFHGLVQARFALGNSYNIPAVRVLYLNGVANFVKFANKMGLTTLTDPSRYGLSLTLGGGEVRMVDMAVAFGVFANSGIKQNLVSILKVEDWHGKILEETKIKEGDRIIPMEVAYIISHILLDNNARSAAFGESSYLNVRGHPEVSVKTGTTNDKRDNWTIGYTPEAVVAVWVGNNDNTPMSAVASGVTGASPIWNKIMRETLDRIEDGKLAGTGQIKEKHSHVWMSKPDGVIGHNVCATSGTLEATASSETSQNENCPSRFEYFQEGDYSLPPVERQPVAILRDTGMLAPPNSPPEQTEIQEHNVVKDPLGTIVCLDCPIPTWSVTVR